MRTKTSRGFTDYGTVKGLHDATVNVKESSSAFKGAHVWLFVDNPSLKESGDGAIQINVDGAKQLIASLQEFIEDAEGNKLTEPAEYSNDDDDEND